MTALLDAARISLGALRAQIEITESGDLDRVRRLATRSELDDAGVALVSAYCRRYPNDPRCPECVMRGRPSVTLDDAGVVVDSCPVCNGLGVIVLRQRQAEALRELVDCRGLFAPMRVGSGKTLVTLLAGHVLFGSRPCVVVLMVPASCVDKTRDEFALYFKAWRVRMPYVLSYETLGHPDHEHDLLKLRPDLLILDEAHKSRNKDASTTRRIRRCVELVNPIVMALSGTLITDHLMDYHHHALWSLRGNAPVPAIEAEAERWAAAVDKDVPLLERAGEGALVTLPGGFHAFMRSRRGVMPTPGSDCNAAIEISRWRPTLPQALRDAITMTEASGLRPDGELLDPMRIADCLCELAQGFYNVWDPMPPAWWLDPRRAYFGYERDITARHLDGFDSPEHVRRGLDRFVHGGRDGPIPPDAADGARLLAAWRDAKKRLPKPPTVPVWIDDSPIRECVDTVKRGTVIWTRRRAAGEKLASLGVPYYGAATNASTHRGNGTIACSIAAQGTGKNLQYKWHRARVIHPPANPEGWEQLIGRFHREGQRADAVYFEIIDAIDYHREAMSRVRGRAHTVSEHSGFEQKLVAATWIGG